MSGMVHAECRAPGMTKKMWGNPFLPRISRLRIPEQVLVQALLGRRLLPVVVGADAELEVAHVVRRQLHADLDHLQKNNSKNIYNIF